MKKEICAYLCVLLVVGFVGCKGKNKPEASDEGKTASEKSRKGGDSTPPVQSNPAKGSSQPSLADQMKESPVVVTVNGETITEAQLQQRIAQSQTVVNAQMPESFKEQYEKSLREKLLNEMVTETLLSQKIREKRIVVSSEEVNRCIQNQCRSQKMNQKDLLEMLKAKGQSFDEYKEHTRRELLFEKLIETELSACIEISEDTKKNYYLLHSQEYGLPEQIRISRIFLKVPPDAPDDVKADTKEVADELVERIQNGRDFSSLARTYSDAPSASRGGDEGFFKKGQLKPELEKAVFSLAKGQVSELVKTEDGYHLLKVTEYQKPRTQAYEEVKDEIHAVLLSEKIKESASSYLKELKSQATIVYDD